MKNLIPILLLLFCISSLAEEKRTIIVSKDGDGDFTTLTEAINSLPQFNYQRTTIFVKNGIYEEKIRIEQDYISIIGESRENTIIQFNQLRSAWDSNKDSIGPAVINIFADDFILQNITVINTQPEIGPHAFAIYGKGTRTILLNANIKSKGADTVSLWDNKNGMYYHANCSFEGSVDFVCPRGWCFIKNSTFYELKSTASVWHAGGDDKDQKFVIVNSSFDGVEGFELGRHHYDAQFYFLGCTFSPHMSTKEIYRVTYPKEPDRDRPDNWGKRDYFYNSKGDTIKYKWLKDNFASAAKLPVAAQITAEWTFGGKWNPEKEIKPKIISYSIESNKLILVFIERITVINKPNLESVSHKTFVYHSGGGTDTIQFQCNDHFTLKDLEGLKIVNVARLINTIATVDELDANLNIYD